MKIFTFVVSAIFTIALFCVASSKASAALWVITYPQSIVIDDERTVYPLSLLELALSKTGVRFEIRPSSSPIRQQRAVKRLEENLEINLMWTMTDLQREEDLLPIRIPISKGLSGWRLLLVKSNHPLYQKPVQDIEQLLEYEPVQGIAWPDTKILQNSGFNVVTGRDYTESRELLLTGAADFFPRAITEVYSEQKKDGQADGLRIKSKVALRYPTAMYFFVNKRNKTLAKLVETGLMRAIEDGSFDAHFEAFYANRLRSLETSEFVYFELDNQLLPPQTPVFDQRFWYKPPAKVK
ncbi:MAG: amino acid ABC transporter substrate-binding protein [Pseudomonadota bacterium]